jgi:site-specific recombinase XerD
MTDVVLTGDLLPASDTQPAHGDGPLFDPEVERLVAEWLLGYGSANTRAAYASDLRHWLGFLADAGEHPVTEAKRLHIHAWLRAQEAAEAKPATRARRLAAVSAWYTWLIVEERTERANPAQIDSRRKPKSPEKSTAAGMDREDVDALLDAADADTSPQAARTRALVYLLFFTGIRVSEAIGADVDDYEIHKGHQGLRITTKGESEHVVVVPAPAAHRIKAYLAGREDLHADRLPVPAGQAGAKVGTRPLFVTDSGHRLDRGAVQRLLTRLAKKAKLKVRRISPHSLRHGFATLARDAGVPLEDVQDALNHADPRTTRRYDHGGQRLDRSPGYTLAAYLTGHEAV